MRLRAADESVKRFAIDGLALHQLGGYTFEFVAMFDQKLLSLIIGLAEQFFHFLIYFAIGLFAAALTPAQQAYLDSCRIGS
jgi:hypothetical protein